MDGHRCALVVGAMISRRNTFPVGPFGRASTSQTCRGYVGGDPLHDEVAELLGIDCCARAQGNGGAHLFTEGVVGKPDLRHSCASLAISAGVNVLALRRMLGHTSAKVTLDTYADLFDDDLDTVAVTLHARYSLNSLGKLWAKTGHHDDLGDQKSSSPA
jgi:hypothetical protein